MKTSQHILIVMILIFVGGLLTAFLIKPQFFDAVVTRLFYGKPRCSWEDKLIVGTESGLTELGHDILTYISDYSDDSIIRTKNLKVLLDNNICDLDRYAMYFGNDEVRNDSVFRDPWGTPIDMIVEDIRFILISYGPNKRCDNLQGDDIVKAFEDR